MPRYYFHTVDGGRERDAVGAELADHAAARAEATQLAGAVLKDEQNLFWNGQDFRIEVTDENSRLLFTIITVAVDATQPICDPV